MKNSVNFLFNMNRSTRLQIRFFIETLAVVGVYYVWLANLESLQLLSFNIHASNFLIWLFSYRIFGLNKDRLRFSSLQSYIPIFKVSLVISMTLTFQFLIINRDFDIFTSVLLMMSFFNSLIGLRVAARQLIRNKSSVHYQDVLVYGTSHIAIDLVNALTFSRKYKVVGFISESGQKDKTLAGLPVIRFEDIQKFTENSKCKMVVIANRNLNSASESEMLTNLDSLGLSVSYAPTIDRAFDYEIQLKAVNPEDMLGRMKHVSNESFGQEELNLKTILITGGGGSIGSELCHQVLKCRPRKLIVLELNEFALHCLEQRLSLYLAEKDFLIDIDYRLGSVNDEILLNDIFNGQRIDIVLHVAAYKHVPIIENNIVAGIQTNVFGTRSIAYFAHRFSVAKFLLVSTDKAVRPSNVMGATKRIAELIIQDLNKSSETIFTTVRFGNVLGSSGSVIPKFKAQINAGGPITVTHKEITRYFMSIPEAAHLVLNAVTFAAGGEVFLLEMGKAIKISDLAETMVRQHGLRPVFASEIKGRKKRDNEISIEFSGLRPGEKLYEELLVDGKAQKTPHPKIYKSNDGNLNELDVANTLQSLEKLIHEGSREGILRYLQTLPISYQPASNSDLTNFEHLKKYQKVNSIREKPAVKDPSSLFAYGQNPRFLHRIISSRVVNRAIHFYFFISRGMTLGVRVLVQNDKNEILLVRHSYQSGWHLPGGGVDHDEDVETAARREVFEETGVNELTELQFIGIHRNKAVSKRDHVSYFKAKANQNVTCKRTAEIAESRFVPLPLAIEIISSEYKKFLVENF